MKTKNTDCALTQATKSRAPRWNEWKRFASFSAGAAFCLMTTAANAQFTLLNVNFGAHLSPPPLSTVKTGPAAVGLGTSDYWNFYSRDNDDLSWRTHGSLANLKLADGTITSAGLAVANAPGSWGNGSADAMYDSYIYPFSGNATFTLTNVAAGSYDLLIYSYDGNTSLTVGATAYGNRAWHDNAPAGVPVWQEGRQYTRYAGIAVGPGDALSLTIQPGIDGYAVISGLQLVAVPEPGIAALLAVGVAILSTRRKSL